MALTKSTVADLLAIQSVASNSVVVGSPIDISSLYEVAIRTRLGRGTGTAFTAAPEIRLEGTLVAGAVTVNDWTVLSTMSPAVGTALASQAVSGTEDIGQTAVTLAAGTNFAAGDFCFFHNTTIGNSEWSHVLSVSGATITLEEGIVFAQTGATCRDQAEEWVRQISGSWKQLRLVASGFNTGQAFVIHSTYNGISAL